MAIDVACQCGQRFRAKAELAGKRVACTKCGQPIDVPGAPSAATAPAAAGGTIVVACTCGARFSARESSRGRQVACPKCSQPLKIGESVSPALTTTRSLWDELPASAPGLTPAAAAMRYTVASAAESMPAPEPADPLTAGTKRPAWEFAVGMVLCLGILIVAVALLGVSVVKIGAAAESNGWQPSTATITHSEVVSERRGRRQGRRYKAIVRYSYVVNLVPYSSDRVTMGDEASVIDGRWTASKYKVGTNHTAWFNPQRPAEAVLEKGISLTNIFWLLASMIVLIASGGGAIFCGVFAWRRMKSNS